MTENEEFCDDIPIYYMQMISVSDASDLQISIFLRRSMMFAAITDMCISVVIVSILNLQARRKPRTRNNQ